MIENVLGWMAAIGGGAFAIAVFGLGWPDDPTGHLVGGVASVLMLIGGFGTVALRTLERRRGRDRTT